MGQPKAKQDVLHRQFDQCMPRMALRALGVLTAYHHLHSKSDATEAFGEVGEARCGLLRWIATDADALRIMRSGFTGVGAELVGNPTNGGKHVEIVCGDFKILLIHDADPEAQVPISDYATEDALKNRYPLFVSDDEWKAEHPAAKRTLYTAILFHSKTSTSSLPSTLEIRFPDGTGDYQALPIDLYTRFAELKDDEAVNRLYAEITMHVPEEIVEDQAHPKVRKVAKSNA
jgi:hypothetical protein